MYTREPHVHVVAASSINTTLVQLLIDWLLLLTETDVTDSKGVASRPNWKNTTCTEMFTVVGQAWKHALTTRIAALTVSMCAHTGFPVTGLQAAHMKTKAAHERTKQWNVSMATTHKVVVQLVSQSVEWLTVWGLMESGTRHQGDNSQCSHKPFCRIRNSVQNTYTQTQYRTNTIRISSLHVYSHTYVRTYCKGWGGDTYFATSKGTTNFTSE